MPIPAPTKTPKNHNAQPSHLRRRRSRSLPARSCWALMIRLASSSRSRWRSTHFSLSLRSTKYAVSKISLSFPGTITIFLWHPFSIRDILSPPSLTLPLFLPDPIATIHTRSPQIKCHNFPYKFTPQQMVTPPFDTVCKTSPRCDIF